jgi:hypothetical protein
LSRMRPISFSISDSRSALSFSRASSDILVN